MRVGSGKRSLRGKLYSDLFAEAKRSTSFEFMS